MSSAGNGNVARTDNNRITDRSQRFTYDELNRVKTAQTQATTGQHFWGETFTYDIWANLLSIGAITPDYDGCTQESGLAVTATTKNQISGFTYDAAGNLITVPPPFPASYTYDAENRMSSSSVSGVSGAYLYDGDGKRAGKGPAAGNWTKLYWYGMGSDPLLETDLGGNNPTEFVFFDGKRIARRDSAGTISYFFSDKLSSSRVSRLDASSAPRPWSSAAGSG